MAFTGGASVGEKVYAKVMFGRAGLEFLFFRILFNPGKPVWLWRAGRRLVLELPGSPTSALVTARLILAPLLCSMTGGSRPKPRPDGQLRSGRHWHLPEIGRPFRACMSLTDVWN